jgi:hypothetical protein
LISRLSHPGKRLASALLALAMVFIASPPALAGNQLAGQWTLTLNFPESANSSHTIEMILNLDVSPRGESLNGRANITDQAGRKFGAAWRQVGKRVSIAFELPCSGDGPCGSLILQGKVKGGGVLIKKGSVIVMWDTENDRNPALYDTSNGSFHGDRIE